MVNEETGVERLEREIRLMAGSGEGRFRATTRSGHGVKVDVVRHLARRVVFKSEIHHIILTHPDELAGDAAAESPEGVIHTVGHPFDHLGDLDLDLHIGRMLAGDRRRNVRRIGQDRDFLALERNVFRFRGWS